MKKNDMKVSVVLGYGESSVGVWYLCFKIVYSKENRPQCCLAVSGTSHSVTWCHIPEKERPQLDHCKTLYIYKLYYFTGKSGKDQTQRHSDQNWCFRCISTPLSGKSSICCLWPLSVPQGKIDTVLSHIP